MKKFILLMSILAVFVFGNASNTVPVEDAVKASLNFLSERIGSPAGQFKTLTLAYTEYDEDGTPLYYRFQVGDKGFIIVSATYLATPVLAYSLEENYGGGDGISYLCGKYKSHLNALVKDTKSNLQPNENWAYYLNNNFKIRSSKGLPAIEPLTTTCWSQEKYYNTYCPHNPEADYQTTDKRAYVGCVALTMGNIMYYYRYPASGNGGVTYIPREFDDEGNVAYVYPIQSVDFGTTYYNYDAMANSLDQYNGELAKLIYNCGVSVRMSYGTEGSSSNSELALEALQDFFRYSTSAQYKKINDVVTHDSLTYKWEDIIKEELEAHRPVFFSAHPHEMSGHAWIVDGYTTIRDSTFFHVNWGWAGYGNGFFLVMNQNSGTQGVFNEDEAIMVGLEPADSTAYAKPATSETRVTASFGTISDGAGNLKYAPNSNRKWVIACPNANSYTLDFSKLKVKAGDKVVIYNGGTENADIKKTYSGNYLMAACSDYANVTGGEYGDYTGTPLPEPITIQQDSILIVFTSTANSATDYGFVLNYHVNSYNTDKCKEYVNIAGSQTSGVLTDEVGDDAAEDTPYRAAATCKWLLRLKNSTGYALNFEKFDLKEGDFIDFYDFTSHNNPTFISRFDNYNVPDGPFSVYTPQLLVVFVSDNWIQGNGFELQYDRLTGIDDHSGLDNVSIYPNPASTNINVSIETDDVGIINAQILDLTGKVVHIDEFKHQGGKQTYQIPVGKMAEGIYFLHLQTQRGKTIRKFAVQ